MAYGKSKSVVLANSLTAKKSLGQHFLHDQEICQQIVAAITYTPNLNLLEIGPGPGAITKYILQQDAVNFKCIELDEEKVNYLHNAYPQLKGKIQLIDFLDAEPPFEEAFAIIGNFPYNISTQIVFKILDWEQQVEQVVGMFQKEVAQRFAAPHGSKTYGITSVITQCYYDITYLFEVPGSAFTPPPNVTSAVIKLVKNNNPHQIKNYKRFKTFIKAAFSQRRKTLRNALKGTVPTEKLQDEIFNLRAEQLSVARFATLYKTLFIDE